MIIVDFSSPASILTKNGNFFNFSETNYTYFICSGKKDRPCSKNIFGIGLSNLDCEPEIGFELFYRLKNSKLYNVNTYYR